MESKTLLEYKIEAKDYLYKVIRMAFFILLMSFLVTFLSDIGIRKKYDVTFSEAFFLISTIFIIYLFFMTRMTHLWVKSKNSKVYLSLTYVRFLFFTKTKTDLINTFEFSFKEERTSRIGKNIVFKLYYKSNLMINRSSDFDGFSELQIEEMVLKLREIGLREV